MNSLDLILLIPIALGFVFGLFKGLIRELASLAAIVLGIYGAKLLTPMVSDFLTSKFDFSSKTSQPIAFLLIFLVIGIGLLFLAKILDKIFEAMYLGGLNKLLGGLFGGLKFALIVSVLLNVFNALDSRFSILSAETKENSIGYKPLMKLGPTLWDEVKQGKTE
ncbi:MAG: CvpA family protein [Paludibacter sp.]